MKHLYALLLLAVSTAQANDDCREPITQAEMNNCAMQDYTKADAELNAAYKKLVATYGKEQLATTYGKEQLGRLRAAQRAWITFRDAQCRYESGVYEGGSIAPLIHSGCLTKLTEQRTKDLIAEFEQP